MKWSDHKRGGVMHTGRKWRNAQARTLAKGEDGDLSMTGDTLVIRLDGVIYDCKVRRWVDVGTGIEE